MRLGQALRKCLLPNTGRAQTLTGEQDVGQEQQGMLKTQLCLHPKLPGDSTVPETQGVLLPPRPLGRGQCGPMTDPRCQFKIWDLSARSMLSVKVLKHPPNAPFLLAYGRLMYKPTGRSKPCNPSIPLAVCFQMKAQLLRVASQPAGPVWLNCG